MRQLCRPRTSVVTLLLLLAIACGTGSDGVTPCCPPPPDTTGVVPGSHTGPVEITFLAAEPPPGATVDGCRTDLKGCSGRVRMRFRLRYATGGPLLDAVAFLHASNKLACFRAATGPFTLQPAVDQEVLFVFDQPDPACGVPAEIANMKVVLGGPNGIDSLQEWSIHYALRP